MSQAPRPAFVCGKCLAKFDDRDLLWRHKRIQHQRSVTAKSSGNVKTRIRRTPQGFICPQCNQAFEDPLTCKHHFPSCNGIQHVPAPVSALVLEPVPVPAPAPVSAPLQVSQRLPPVRNPHKTVPSRATRAAVRQYHKRAYTDLEIANHLSISPVAVRSVIQNESGDNEGSDDEHVVDADGLSDEALAELCEPRTTDLQGIPFSTKTDEAEDLDIHMEDLWIHQVAELDRMAIDESVGAVPGSRLNSPDVPVPRIFRPSPSHSPKPAISPIRVLYDDMDDDSDDIRQVEQILIDSDRDLEYPEDDDEIKLEPAALSVLPLHDVTEEIARVVDPAVEQASHDQACSSSPQVPPPTPPTSTAQEHHSETAAPPMALLADPIEMSLFSLGDVRQWIAPLFKTLGCITQADFDALSCMPMDNVRNFFFWGLRHSSAEQVAPHLPAIEAALLERQMKLARLPWEMPTQGRLSYTAVSDFLRSLRCSLTHHLELLYSQGVTGLDELDELCRQKADGGLQLAFYVFVNKGAMSFFEYLVLWEGLHARATRLKPPSARAVAPPPTSRKLVRRERVKQVQPERPIVAVTLVQSPQIDGVALYHHLVSLDPPLSHLFAPLSAFGIRSGEDLRYCLGPELRDEFRTACLDRGMSIWDCMALTHAHEENAPTYISLFDPLNTMSPPISFIADALWSAGIRTMEDIRVLSHLPRHWAGVRERLLAAPGSSTLVNWLVLKRTMRSLNPPAEPIMIDDDMRYFLRCLSRSLLKYSTVFSTCFCLDNVEELDILCKMPEQWNALCHMMLDSGKLVLMDALAFLGGLERRAEDLSRRP